MTFGNPFGGAGGADMDPALRQRILEMLAQQPTQDEVPDATPPGFSGFTPPDAPTDTVAMRLGAGPAALPSLQSLPMPLGMMPGEAQKGPAFPQSALSGPLLTGAVPPSSMAPQADPLASVMNAPAAPAPAPAPSAPPQMTGPANSVSQPDASAGARMPTLLGMRPPTMPQAAKPETPDAGDGEDTPPNAGVSAPRAPATYTGLPGDKPVAAPNAVPGAPAPAVSAPPAGSLLATAPGSTAAPAAPSRPANAAPAVAEPSIWKRLADAGIGDQMIALGAGIAGGKTFGEGLGAGLEGVSRLGQVQAASRLAQTKAAQQQAQLLGNANLLKRVYPQLSDQELIGMAGNSGIVTDALKRLMPSETYATETDKDGNLFSVNKQNGQRSLILKADEDKTVTDLPEEDRIKRGLPPGVYQVDAHGKLLTAATAPERVRVLTDDERAREGLPPGSYQRDLATNKITPIGQGGTTVNVDLGKKAAGEADAQILKKIDTSHDKAQGAIDTLGAISRQKQALDQGIISGWGSNFRTNAQAMAEQLLGITPDEKLDPSYTFEAAAKQKGAALAKAISQAGHTTNMDLQLGNSIAGGDREKTASALRQIIDAQEILARKTIEDHNKSVDRFTSSAPDMKDRMNWYKVETPEVYRYGQGRPNPVADPGAAPAYNVRPSAPMTPAKELTFDPKTGSFK